MQRGVPPRAPYSLSACRCRRLHPLGCVCACFVQVDAIFRSSCRRRWDPQWCTHRICYPDEHYLPTLLAWHGADNESDCTGELTGAQSLNAMRRLGTLMVDA